GSRAVAGTFDESVLNVRDANGLTMREAMMRFGLGPEHIGAAARTRRELHAYVELHIEQGPVLEQQDLPVGVVTAISGATRLAVADIVRRIEAIAKRRDLSLQIDVTHENRTVPCAPWLKAQVAEAVAAEGCGVFELPSGAGHDGMAMIDIADVAMLFVRCRGG